METSGKKVEHTQGLWLAKGTTILDENGFGIGSSEDILVRDNWAAMDVDHWSRKPGETYREITLEEAEANAQLFASAPSLLSENKSLKEVNKELLEACEGLLNDMVYDKRSSLTVANYNKAYTAIQKAKTI